MNEKTKYFEEGALSLKSFINEDTNRENTELTMLCYDSIHGWTLPMSYRLTPEEAERLARSILEHYGLKEAKE